MNLLTNQELNYALQDSQVTEAVAKVGAKAISTAGTKLSKVFGRTGLILQHRSPEILLTLGIVGVVGAAVLACRATLKTEEVLSDANEKINKIKGTKELYEECPAYSEKEYKKEMTVAYVQTSVDFIKLYGPSVTLGAASIACIIGAHGIMKKRSVALMAAYKVVEEGFAAYRNRVKEEFGDEKDYMFKNNLRYEEIEETVVDEDGKKKKVKRNQLVEKDPITGYKVYARVFEKATTREWSPAEHYNEAYIKGQQTFFNQLLATRGHVFLNEVYDALGFKRSKEGALVGWVLDGNGDNYIDFGLDKNNDYWNGMVGDFLLDFNVDGVIYDLI